MKKFVPCAAALACSAAAGLSMAADKSSVMVVLSPGFEEGETVEIIDVMRRNGIKNGSSSKNRRSCLKGN